MSDENSKPKSKSEQIVIDIYKNYYKIDSINNRIDKEVLKQYGDDPFADDSNIRNKYSEDLDTLKHNIFLLLKELYYSSTKDNYFYFDCSTEVYEKHYELRKNKFFDEILDSTEEDFLISEVKYFSNQNSNRCLDNGIFDFFNYSSYIEEYSNRYRIPLNKKLKFLDNKLKFYNKTLEIKENIFDSDGYGNDFGPYTEVTIIENKSNQFTIKQPHETSEVDNNTKQLTSNQIVLLLQETGFFTNSIIANAPKTKQSELISKITGLNAKNIKNKIENLDKKPSELGENYQNDIYKINFILSKME